MLQPALPLFQTYLLPALTFRRHRKRRQTSVDSTSTTTTSSTTASNTLTNPHQTTRTADAPFPPNDSPSYLKGHTSTISCQRCHADLALTTQIISKGFTGRHGRAYLVAPAPYTSLLPSSGYPLTTPNPPGTNTQPNRYVSALPNTHTHKPVPRHLVTGMHTVCDVSCALCGSVVGWKYVGAEEESQRYKVGKFILESRRTVVGVCWENGGSDFEEGDGGVEGGVDDAVWGESAKMGLKGKGGSGVVMFDSEDEDECEDLFAGIWSPQLARKRREKRIGRR